MVTWFYERDQSNDDKMESHVATRTRFHVLLGSDGPTTLGRIIPTSATCHKVIPNRYLDMAYNLCWLWQWFSRECFCRSLKVVRSGAAMAFGSDYFFRWCSCGQSFSSERRSWKFQQTIPTDRRKLEQCSVNVEILQNGCRQAPLRIRAPAVRMADIILEDKHSTADGCNQATLVAHASDIQEFPTGDQGVFLPQIGTCAGPT